MKTALIRSLATLIPVLCLAPLARGASDTWTGAVDGDFLNAGNWLGGNVPGTAGLGNTSTDTATFLDSLTPLVELAAERNLKFITFENSRPGLDAYQLSGETISFTSNVSIVQVIGMWGAADQQIDNPLLLNRATGANDFVLALSPGYAGTLSLHGPITTATAGATTQFTVRTAASGHILLNGGIHDNGTGVVQLITSTTSTGPMTLGGTNTFTGGITLNGSKLTIDDSAGAAVLGSTNATTLNNATLEFRGAATGASEETVGNILVSQFSSNRVILNPNGGNGMTVTAAGLGISNTGAVGLTLIQLGANSTFKTAAPLPGASTAGASIVNGIVMSSGSNNNYRASYLVQDASGALGFATQNASNEIVRYTGATVLAAGANEGTATSGTGHYLIEGDLSRTASLPFSTLQIDTAAAPVTISMGGNSFHSTQVTGRTLLVTGTNDATITGTGTIGSTLFTRQHSSGALTLDMAFAGGQALLAGGPGHTTYTKAMGADLYVMEGTLRMTLDQPYTGGTLRIYDGGVLELGADLSTGAADFSRALNAAPGGGQIGFFGSGGFSAHTAAPGGTRTVSLGTGGSVQWAANGFVSGAFVLSSDRANATLEFQNAIDLNNINRLVETRDGSAEVDARFTGGITDTGGALSGIYKTGAGTLELAAAANSYDGNTEVADGRLLLTGALTGTNAVIASGGTIELGNSDVIRDVARVKLEAGTLATGGYSDTVGALTLAGTATLDLGAGNSILQFANSSAELWSGALTIAGWSGDVAGGGIDQVYFGFDASGLTPDQVSLARFLDPAGFAPGLYEAELLPTGELVAVPEPASAALLLGGVALLATRRRSRARS